MNKAKIMPVAMTLFMLMGVAILYASSPSFDRIPIKIQTGLETGSNGSVISFVEYGAEYMRNSAGLSET